MKNFLSTAILLFLLGSSSILSANKANITSADISRILQMRSHDKTTFVVLEKLNDDHTAICHNYGKNSPFEVPLDSLKKTPFRENTATFIITQHILAKHFCRVGKDILPNGLISRKLQRLTADDINYLPLLELVNDDLQRTDLFYNYLKERRKFLTEFSQSKNKNSNWDQDDILDNMLDHLDNCSLKERILQSADQKDWFLTITLLCDYRKLLHIDIPEVARRQLNDLDNRRFLNSKCKEMSDSIQKILCGYFSDRLKLTDPRHDRFSRLFRHARGVWSISIMPSDANDLAKILNGCFVSYFDLENLSDMFNPQDWGSAVLDVMLLIENGSYIKKLDNDFSQAMDRIEKERQRSADPAVIQ